MWMVSKSKQKVHLCFICTLDTSPEGNFIRYSLLFVQSAFWLQPVAGGQAWNFPLVASCQPLVLEHWIFFSAARTFKLYKYEIISEREKFSQGNEIER